MAKLRRKGKTFVSEHYLSEEGLDALNSAVMELFGTFESNDPMSMFRGICLGQQVFVWVDPRGLYASTDHSDWSSYDLYPWGLLSGVNDATIKSCFIACVEVTRKYGTDVRKICMNDSCVSDLVAMGSL